MALTLSELSEALAKILYEISSMADGHGAFGYDKWIGAVRDMVAFCSADVSVESIPAEIVKLRFSDSATNCLAEKFLSDIITKASDISAIYQAHKKDLDSIDLSAKYACVLSAAELNLRVCGKEKDEAEAAFKEAYSDCERLSHLPQNQECAARAKRLLDICKADYEGKCEEYQSRLDELNSLRTEVANIPTRLYAHVAEACDKLIGIILNCCPTMKQHTPIHEPHPKKKLNAALPPKTKDVKPKDNEPEAYEPKDNAAEPDTKKQEPHDIAVPGVSSSTLNKSDKTSAKILDLSDDAIQLIYETFNKVIFRDIDLSDFSRALNNQRIRVTIINGKKGLFCWTVRVIWKAYQETFPGRKKVYNIWKDSMLKKYRLKAEWNSRSKSYENTMKPLMRENFSLAQLRFCDYYLLPFRKELTDILTRQRDTSNAPKA